VVIESRKTWSNGVGKSRLKAAGVRAGGGTIKKLLHFLPLAFALGFLACSVGARRSEQKQNLPPTNVAPGTITVDVLEREERERYWTYQVEPTTGEVRLRAEQTFPDYRHRQIPSDFRQPAGAIETCSKSPEALSPNGHYLAYCRSNEDDDFYVVDAESKKTIMRWNSHAGIRGFAWAPNSGSVAILVASGRVGMKPSELLAFISGHPISHNTVRLEVLDPLSGNVAEYQIRENVVSAFTRILSWVP